MNDMTPESRLQTAARLVNESRFKEAIPFAQAAVHDMPGNYWALFYLAQSLLGDGQTEAGVGRMAEAAASPDLARAGAKFLYAMEQAKAGSLAFRGMLSGALEDAEGTDQKRWYFTSICILQALGRVARGEPLALAERDLRIGYRFLCDASERRFRFGWAVDALSGRDLSGFPYLAHLRNALTTEGGPRLGAELGRLGQDTVVLEIGANDGVKTDQLRPFIVGKQWEAVLVEPVGATFRRLCANYAAYPKVRCSQVAITDQVGPVTMNMVDPAKIGMDGIDPDWADAVSSLNASGALQFYRDHLIKETVEGITFAEFAKRENLTRFDVLQIDTEGHDFVIFDQIDLDRYGVKVVQVEIRHLQPPDRLAIFETLRSGGFRISYDSHDLTASRI